MYLIELYVMILNYTYYILNELILSVQSKGYMLNTCLYTPDEIQSALESVIVKRINCLSQLLIGYLWKSIHSLSKSYLQLTI